MREEGRRDEKEGMDIRKEERNMRGEREKRRKGEIQEEMKGGEKEI